MGEQIVIRPEFRGNIRRIFSCRNPEAILSGPAGTGKSIGIWNKLHACLLKYPGARVLALRKTLTSLTTSGIVTFERHVLHAADGVTFFGGSPREPANYRYPNGSRLVVGGLDRPTKVLSSEYDIIYIQESTEATEEEWELCSTRLRNNVIPYQQMLGDCNPDAPTHWIKQRAAAGKLTLLETRHEDNPHYFDAATSEPTEAGKTYIERLDNLSGVRYKRYRLGLWVAAEGQVYEDFDTALHIIDRTKLTANAFSLWKRIWAVDFGYTNPFVWLEFLISPDNDMYLSREIYRSERLVEDHARDILAITGRRMDYDVQGKPTGRIVATREKPDPLPDEILCDHDAEDRQTLERHLGMVTKPASKGIKDGIQDVQTRLRKVKRSDGSERPTLFFLRDSLIHPPDQFLLDRKLPTCTVDEIPGYVWNDKTKKEQPVDADNHGCDGTRYAARAVATPKPKLQFF